MLARTLGLIKQTNSGILEVLMRDSEVLARVQDAFFTMVRSRDKEHLPPIEITCFFEELPLPGIGVVSGQIVGLQQSFLTSHRSFLENLQPYQATFPSQFDRITWT